MIIERLKKSLNFSKDIEVANFFDVAQNTISAWKKRNSMNYEALFAKCATHRIDLNWLIFGDVEMSDHAGPIMYKGYEDLPEASMDVRAQKYIHLIRNLPWPTSMRREIMENYLDIVTKEIDEEDDQSMAN